MLDPRGYSLYDPGAMVGDPYQIRGPVLLKLKRGFPRTLKFRRQGITWSGYTIKVEGRRQGASNPSFVSLSTDSDSYFTLSSDLNEITMVIPASVTAALTGSGLWSLSITSQTDPNDSRILVEGTFKVVEPGQT